LTFVLYTCVGLLTWQYKNLLRKFPAVAVLPNFSIRRNVFVILATPKGMWCHR